MISLRTATRDDIPALAYVLAHVQAQNDPAVDVEEYRLALIDGINEYFGADEPESILSIIELDGEPVGRFRVVRFPDRIFLGGIQIHPAFQSRGIGTHLVDALIRESRSSARPVHLDVDKNNVRARRLYERLGFERTAETEGDYHMVFQPIAAVASRPSDEGDAGRS